MASQVLNVALELADVLRCLAEFWQACGFSAHGNLYRNIKF
jgi:hypothetical protein